MNMIRKYFRKATGPVLAGALLSIGVMVTPTPSESAPCSCWSAGTIGCQKWNVAGCSRCWAGWDTGVFSPKFDMSEVQKVKDHVNQFYAGIMSKENWEKAADAVGKATGVPIKTLWDPILTASSFIGAGIDDMENCRKACQSVNAKYKLNQSVWWYADETAKNSCKDYDNRFNPNNKIFNKYQYEIK